MDSTSPPEVHSALSRWTDPTWGAGITALGIVAMGITGARGEHYPFNIATAVALAGAAWFVLSLMLRTRRRV